MNEVGFSCEKRIRIMILENTKHSGKICASSAFSNAVNLYLKLIYIMVLVYGLPVQPTDHIMHQKESDHLQKSIMISSQ